MNKVMGAGALLLLSTGMAAAGGLDRTGLGISPLFEDGDYAELSFGYVAPDVSGTFPLNGAGSGNMAQTYSSLGAAVKTDLNDRISLALIFEEAFGAAVDYSNTDLTYPVQGFEAELNGRAISALLKYQVSDRFSVHGGLRYVTMTGEIDATSGGNPVFNYEASSDVGYAIGASYEIPDIALRATLTYNSETTHNNDITIGGTLVSQTGTYTLPQSVNLDFQTGVAQNTLLLASVRWAEWTATAIDTDIGGLGVIDYDYDVTTYTLGVARRFTEDFAGLLRVSYEESNGTPVSNLAPTDGSIGLTVAGIYTMDDITLTAGINYTMLGDATTETISGDFTDNDAFGVGIRVGYNF